jgi:hypothetical protein
MVLLLIGLITLSLCGMLILRERCSTFAIRKAQFERVQEGMTEEEVIAILGKPTEAGWWRNLRYSVWQMGSDRYRDGIVFIDFHPEEDHDGYVVTEKLICAPWSFWDRLKEALQRLGEDERLGQTFAF